ncbi:MAG: hypothetical protein E6L07_00930 [Verrucomicrobia bacterium]|nr:MAG: hypothetical protein E6L07_00930 [Verrucomicrobiota bacterium]
MEEKRRRNADPITGKPGAHPIGTGVGGVGGSVAGAAVGTVVGGIAAAYGAHGVAEGMNPTTEEEKYWREHHEKQPFVKPSYTYEHYAPAYRTGYEGFHKYPGKAYEEIENDLALDYDRNKAGSALPWDHARHAVHAAWAKVSHDIGPRDPDRGIRSGM